MFGLPLFRSGTKNTADRPQCINGDAFGCDNKKPKVLKSALRLAQMVYNHYSLVISQDWTRVRTWGSCASYGNTGVSVDTNTPQTAAINWRVPAAPENIIKMYSNGYMNGWGRGFTIFKTESGNLYGTGYNTNYILNQTSTGNIPSYEFIVGDVTDFCISGHLYMLYVRNDGKVYGLGPKLTAGFGFANGSQIALTKDTGTTSNYLGISNGSKVFTTSPDDNAKSFVLLSDGTVMTCGYNTSGCLGVDSVDPIIYGWRKVKTIDSGGNKVDLTDVIDIVTTNYVYVGGAAGGSANWTGGGSSTFMSTYFLTKTGYVYTCGSNKFGQLGLNLPTTNTVSIATKTSLIKVTSICTTAGGTSMLATTLDNEVYTWGNNQWGQLGNGTTNISIPTPTKVTFPTKKIKIIHGGGMYGIINGAFLIVCEDGSIYGAGYNETYALGLTDSVGNPDKGPITTFRKNNFFGTNPSRKQDPARYPITITGSVTTGSKVISSTAEKVSKYINQYGKMWTEDVYIRPGMSVTGTGIDTDTEVVLYDSVTNEIHISKPAIATAIATQLTYENIIKVYQADLCGYGTEMAQKVVSEDGTLYMSGWNQQIGAYWNFNPYYGSQNVSVPTFFDAKFS